MKVSLGFQFVPINSGTIGHFVSDTEKIISNYRQMKEGGDYFRLFLIKEKRISNHYFLKILQKHFCILPNFPFNFLHAFLRRVSVQYRVRTELLMRKDQSLMIDIHKTPPLHSLVRSEEAQGEQFLTELGIPIGSKIVCCVLRDHGYDISQNEADFVSKQGYRVTPLDTFIPMVSELISLGYYVIRMGRHNSNKLSLTNPKYFDRTEWKFDDDDFFDVYLFSISEFTVSTGSGIDALSSFFRKPTLFLNCSTIADLPHTKLWTLALIPNFVREPLMERIPLKSLLDDKIASAWPPSLLSEGIRITPKSSNDFVKALRIFMEQLGYSTISSSTNSDYETLENLLY